MIFAVMFISILLVLDGCIHVDKELLVKCNGVAEKDIQSAKVSIIVLIVIACLLLIVFNL